LKGRDSVRICMFIRNVALVAVLGCVALPGVEAQLTQPPLAPPQQSVPCDAFHKNDNGTWSPTRQVTITSQNGSISLSPGVSFGPGVQFAGINLYVLLEQNCR